MIKGNVKVVRENKLVKLEQQDVLKESDIIRTEEKSFLKINLQDTVVIIAPGSYYQVPKVDPQAKDVSVGRLLYGHLRANFKTSSEEVKPRTISSPTASIGVRGTEVLFHVTRDSGEYSERYQGKFHPIPSLAEISKIIRSKEVFTQICCIKGKILTTTKAKKEVEMNAGEVMNFSSFGADFNTKSYTPSVIRATAARLGLE